MEPRQLNDLIRKQPVQNGLPQRYEQNSVLHPTENEIIALKYASKKLLYMDAAELTKWTKVLLLKISVITGWAIPADETMEIVLKDQFRKDLTEKYLSLNPDEIEHAFRLKAADVEDWGKNMNLSIIDKVLMSYLDDRKQISLKEEKLKYQDDGYCEASSLAWYRETIEMNYRRYLAGEHVTPYWYWYDVLVQDRFIEPSFYKAGLKELQETAQGTDQDLAKEAKRGAVLYLFSVAKGQRLSNLYKKAI